MTNRLQIDRSNVPGAVPAAGKSAGVLAVNFPDETLYAYDEAGQPVVVGAGPYNESLLDNGGFDVWQRGTSFSVSFDHTADRWIMDASGATVNVSRDFSYTQDAIGEGAQIVSKYHVRAIVSVANDNVAFLNRIESVRTAQNRQVTVSFRAIGLANYNVKLAQSFGTGGSPSADVSVDQSIPSNGDWAVHKHTFTLATTAGKTIGTDGNDYLQLTIANQPFETADFRLADVKVEIGGTYTPYRRKNLGEEQVECERFYRSGIIDIALAPKYNSTSNLTRAATVFFPNRMRKKPTITWQLNGTTSQGSLTVVAGDGFRIEATGSGPTTFSYIASWSANAGY
tara:strand:- start:44 stop:1063 length:1020 start_codon:yes stop_codon:yes gene_type:complete